MVQPAMSKWMKKFLPVGRMHLHWKVPMVGGQAHGLEVYRVDDGGWLIHGELGWLLTLHRALIPQAFGYGRKRWAGYGRGTIYPFLYRNETTSWMFLHGLGDGERILLFDYTENLWVILGRP